MKVSGDPSWTHLRKGSDHAEGQCKAQDQNGEQRQDVQQRLHNLQKHDHIDAVDVEATEKKQQGQITGEDADRASHPLVVPRLIEQERQGEHARGHVERPLDVVLDVAEVIATLLEQLNGLQNEVEEAVDDDIPDADDLVDGGRGLKRDELGVRTQLHVCVRRRWIVVIAGRKGDDEVGEKAKKDKVEGEIQHVDGKAVGEPFLSEESLAQRMAEMIDASEFHHHLGRTETGACVRVPLGLRSVGASDSDTLRH